MVPSASSSGAASWAGTVRQGSLLPAAELPWEVERMRLPTSFKTATPKQMTAARSIRFFMEKTSCFGYV